MPIFFQQALGPQLRMAVWSIEEEAPFFLDQGVPPGPATHPLKAVQHLAGRFLLRHLFPGFPLPLIRIADTRKPYLEGADYHFSVSHWGHYAGALVGRHHRVGLDLEGVGEKVHRIRAKFISPADEEVLQPAGLSGPHSATLVWSGKEALFKWYGHGGVDFRKDLRLQEVMQVEDGLSAVYEVALPQFKGTLEVRSRFEGALCLSWVITTG